MAKGSPLISVIVPVYNQWHLIPDLLERLQAQTIGGDRFELLLVDNGSDQLPELAQSPLSIRRLLCTTPGSYAARNQGASLATGEILAFTDADCRPQPQWLAEAVGCLHRHVAAESLIGGAVKVVAADPASPNPYELYDIMLGLPQEFYISRNRFAVTANLILPKAVFDRLAGFEAGHLSGGDVDFCRRAAEHGIALRYCASALVEHPARTTLDALIIKTRRVKAGQLAAASRWRRLHYLLHAFFPPLRGWWRMVRMPGYAPRQKAMVSVIQLRLWMAKMAEAVKLMLGGKPERR